MDYSEWPRRADLTPEAWSAARRYLNGIGYFPPRNGKRDKTYDEVLVETAQIMQAEGLIGKYLSPPSRTA